jgi:FMN hydrolase / 5-amino-6-(5-phospho-D-ribitylamino)uracil phosphatase
MRTEPVGERIKAISFDGDMTLWDFHKAMRSALGQVLARLRERVPGQASADLTVDRMVEIRDLVAEELAGARFEEIRYEAFARTLSALGCDDPEFAAELTDLYRRHRFGDMELYPDVIPVLDVLQSRYTIGLLSNGNSSPDQCGLPGRFSFVVFAQDVGVEKPDPGIFRIACARAGCAPQALLHVGDSLESDVRGANEVGAVSVWLNRDGIPHPTGIVPDFEVQSLTALENILEVGGE